MLIQQSYFYFFMIHVTFYNLLWLLHISAYTTHKFLPVVWCTVVIIILGGVAMFVSYPPSLNTNQTAILLPPALLRGSKNGGTTSSCLSLVGSTATGCGSGYKGKKKWERTSSSRPCPPLPSTIPPSSKSGPQLVGSDACTSWSLLTLRFTIPMAL